MLVSEQKAQSALFSNKVVIVIYEFKVFIVPYTFVFCVILKAITVNIKKNN